LEAGFALREELGAAWEAGAAMRANKMPHNHSGCFNQSKLNRRCTCMLPMTPAVYEIEK
jgi:hypothetical protein